ncbi:MAG: glycosyltransferase family 39 protein, partial [Chloroflexota bacterium]|nr:glycosyltransferase family 39 protein [Chloroflexota bacterium]
MKVLYRHLSFTEWAVLWGTMALAVVLRFYAIGHIPPGLYHDEAFNGLDALRVLGGARPIFFTANNGREPLFIYLVALSVSLLGRSPGAIRVVAAVLGTLTVPATWLLAREMFGWRVGVLSAALVGGLVWPLNLSRIGLRAVGLPLFLALALWQFWRGLDTARKQHYVVAGILYGLSFYTYMAARFTVLALLLFALYQLIFDRSRLHWSGLLCFVLAAGLVLAPLLLYGSLHWNEFMRRAGQVSIFNPAINDGDLYGTLCRHLVRALGLFFWRGDFIPRHNVPWRPLFDPLTAAFFVIGLGLCAGRGRRQPACAFTLIWTATLLLPTVLAEDAPHFLRAVGVLPMAIIPAAVGLDAGQQWLAGRTGSSLAFGATAAVLAVAVGSTTWSYFGQHARRPELGYAFEAGEVQLAVEINRFLGTGWDGTGLMVEAGEPLPGRRVALVSRLWDQRPTLRFLVPASDAVTILRGDGSPRPAPGETVFMALWPHEDLRPYLEWLPVGSVISVHEGALERGDLEEQPHLLYVVFTASPAEADVAPEVHFAEGVTLVGHEVEVGTDGALRVSLRWQATETITTDYIVFVHLLDDGRILAQSDTRPGEGYYPTSWWRPGDVVLDEHR